jgi:hypothetical protein
VNENETPRHTFEFDNASPRGIKPETQESLRILSRCLTEYERENNLQMFLNSKEIGNKIFDSINQQRNCKR